MHSLQSCLTSASLIQVPKLEILLLVLLVKSVSLSLSIWQIRTGQWLTCKWMKRTKICFLFVVKFVFLICFALSAMGHWNQKEVEKYVWSPVCSWSSELESLYSEQVSGIVYSQKESCCFYLDKCPIHFSCFPWLCSKVIYPVPPLIGHLRNRV